MTQLHRVRARGPVLSEDVFAKVGDSVTASGDSYFCLATDRVEYADHAGLRVLVETIRRARAADADPFRRTSEVAQVGWSAWQALHGASSPLARELDAIRPGYALVQFGTNDIEIGQLHYFADRLFDIADFLLARGVVPALFTIMARADRADRAPWVPRYNAVIRAVAQARQIPLVDFHEALLDLPGQGLTSDGIHPTTYRGKIGRNACDFTAAGLRHGYNLRNLLSLEVLARMRAAVAGTLTPDPPPPPLAGRGTAQDPWIIAGRAFVDTPQVPPAGEDLSYEFELDATRTVRIASFDRGGTEVDLTLREAGASADTPPLAQRQRLILRQLTAGRYRLSLTVRQRGTGTGGEQTAFAFAVEG